MSRDLAWNSVDWPVLALSWWAPPAFEALAEAPALGAVVAKHFADAAAWAQARKQEQSTQSSALPTRRSRRRSSQTWNGPPDAVPARSALRISEVPVAGQHLWQLQPDHILISAALLRDTTEYRRRLTAVVQALL